MPTGYTAKLMEEGQSFPDFALTCARAFGALIEMRDDSLDTPIPERFEPSEYSAKRIVEARREIDRLAAMSNDERLAFGESQKAEQIEHAEKWLAKELAQNKRLEEMESKVKAWTPPTPDHTGLKDFMLQQIGVSRNSIKYVEESLAQTRAKSPKDFYSEAIASAEKAIEYNATAAAKEAELAKGRTEWVKKLRASLTP